jgi:mannan endo-1,4-beta-mannosidase
MALHMALLFMFAFQFLVVFGTDLKRWNTCGHHDPSRKRWNDTSNFVSTQDGEFQLNGGPYQFYGTNAYWVQMLTDHDLDNVMNEIAAKGYTVVRTWAFNDVSKKPASGNYFQILEGGKATINEGADGLQRLDKVVAAASQYNLKVLFTLTNNWNPKREQPSQSFKRWEKEEVLPRGYLSNDYGGMDLYDENFAPGATHDAFYTNPVIIKAFKDYVSHVVKRFVDNPAVLGWELANDPRCSSTLPASHECNTTTITNWVDDISSYVKSLDNGHLVTAGDGGFYCHDCPKLFAPPIKEPCSKCSVGPTFDGSFGVDTEDIISVPCVDFGSFQFFPDQVQYYPGPLTKFHTNATVHGARWVKAHGDTAVAFGKPETLLAAGIVTKDNWEDFVPFNSSKRMPPGQPCHGVDERQKDNAFVAWTAVVLSTCGKIGGMLEWMFFTNGLQDVPVVHRKRAAMASSPHTGYSNGYSG